MPQSEIGSFEGYITKVFRFTANLGLLSDKRVFPRKSISDIFSACFYGSVFRTKSIVSISEESREGCLTHRVGSISHDTIQYGLDHLEVASVQEFWNSLNRRAKRNGMFREGEFGDHMVGVLDCIEVYSSYKSQCTRCQKRHVTKSENKVKKKVSQYYHRVVVLTLVGYDFPVPIGMEVMKRGEGEISCALRLLKRLVDQLGKRFLDIIIGDAAYCTPRFFNQCEKMGLVPGAVLKKNQLDLLQTAMAEKKQSQPIEKRKGNKERLKLWDLPNVIWDTADRDVRVIYAEREVWGKADETSDQTGSKEAWVDKKRVFAFSKEMDHLPAQLLYKIGIHRWDIDADLFMNMTQHWHLKHKTLHFENAYENILSIRLIAYMLFMFFFHRHINSRRKNKIKSYLQMARRIYRSACQYHLPKDILLE